jgi:predicted DCC family thiol-disulfide oxidoreductase YuxK
VTTPLFLFDGDCGLCENAVDRMKRRIAPPIDFATYQSVDIDALGVSLATCLEGPVLVRADGSHVVGVGAMAGMLRTARNPYRFFGRAMMAPGVSPLLDRVQSVFYRNRHRLPGGTEACRIPQD